MTCLRIVMIAGLCAVPTAGGCAAKQIEERFAGFETLETLRAVDPVAADDLHLLRHGEWMYAVTAGTGAGGRVVRRRAATQRFNATWVDHAGDRRSEFWRLDEAGNIVMTAVIEHKDRAITFFEPPMIIAYRILPPGRQRSQEVIMRVVDLRNPKRQRDSGTATCTIEYVDDQLLRTELGQFAAKRIVMSFEADLQFANAQTTSTLYIVHGLGAVVEQRGEVVRVLGIPIRRKSQTLVLTSTSPAIPSGDQP